MYQQEIVIFLSHWSLIANSLFTFSLDMISELNSLIDDDIYMITYIPSTLKNGAYKSENIYKNT